MRSAIIAALSALAALAMVSAASATDPSSVHINHAPTVSDKDSPDVNGLTAEQENAIPYRPCMDAAGWVNGRLRCRNY